MQPKYQHTDPREVMFREEAQKSIMEGARKVYEVAKTAYGAAAGNVLIQKLWGDPVLSRDGVTNVREVFLEDEAENQAARVIVQASQKNNQTVGDGTSAVVILAYHILREAQKKVGAGFNPMEVSRAIKEASAEVVGQVDKIKKDVTPELLKRVASISAGDEAIGEMIADTVNEVGIDGGVTVEESPGVAIVNEIVDGFYFPKGFTDVRLTNNIQNLRSEFVNVPLLLTDKRITTAAEIAPILNKFLQSDQKEIVIVGEIAEEALVVLINNRAQGNIMPTVVEPMAYGGNRTFFLEDLAATTGATIYSVGSKVSDFKLDMLGMAEKVIVTEHATTIIGGDADEERVATAIETLKKQLAESDNEASIETIKGRLSRLTGKIAIIRVGGATELEMKESKLRVDDAVCAVQAAIKDGIVPGGGVTLARVKGTYIDDALKEPFKQLMSNAGENAEGKLYDVLKSKDWMGYNLKDMTDAPVDLYEAGVIDPAKVVKETVVNACSVAANLITTSAIITYKKKDGMLSLLALILGLLVGYYADKILLNLRLISMRLKQKQAASAVVDSSLLTPVNTVGDKGSGAVVEPLSVEQMEAEKHQKIRKMNGLG